MSLCVRNGSGCMVHVLISAAPSCSGWLGPEDDPLGYVSRIDQRIEDATGLTMSTAEMLQVRSGCGFSI